MIDAVEPADHDIVIRQSTVGSWLLCPGRVMHSQDEGFNRVPSEPMLFGTVVHNMIEAHLLGGSANAADALWKAQADDEFNLMEYASDHAVEYLLDGTTMAYERWLDHVLPRLPDEQPVYVEQKMQRPLAELEDGRVIWVQGTPDVGYSDRILDWKTAGRGWKENSNGQSKGSFGAQAPTYLWLDGRGLKTFTFYVYDRSKDEWGEYITQWDSSQLSANLLTIEGIGRAIAAGVVYYTPSSDTFGKVQRGWHCSPKYCGAWEICAGKDMLADGVDLEVPIEYGWE